MCFSSSGVIVATGARTGNRSARPDHDTLHSLSDDELLRRLSDLLNESRRAEADLVAHIAEADARRLYARRAMPSMFAYCTEVLHLSEHEAFLRITVARASRRHPVLLAMLRDGRLHLSGIAKLAAHLTAENRDGLLERAAHETKRQIEELVASLAPRPKAAPLIRRLPEARGAQPAALGPDRAPSPPRPESPLLGPARAHSPAPTSRPRVEPVAPSRYRVHFDASTELRDKLERLRALMRNFRRSDRAADDAAAGPG